MNKMAKQMPKKLGMTKLEKQLKLKDSFKWENYFISVTGTDLF